MNAADSIILQPRPYERLSGKLLLLPLLPPRQPTKHLPAEIWYHVFALALLDDERNDLARSLLLVCSFFKEIASSLWYSKVSITKITTLEKFYKILYDADQKWDSIPRIPYSTPGRWVQILNLSKLEFTGQAQALLLDSLLTNLFPLVPFLACLYINPSFLISRRALDALAGKDGIENLRALEGLSYLPPPSPSLDDDPFVRMLRRCTGLEVLDIVGQGSPPDLSFSIDDGPMLSQSFSPLDLPKLHTLRMLAMHSSPLLLALLNSPLLGLRKLAITPYHDLPYPTSLTSRFIEVHGDRLRSLAFLTLKSWPTRLRPSPHTILHDCPVLRHLALERPVPALILQDQHPLEILTIPRPDAEFWRVLQGLLPKLPKLTLIRMRDVRWVREGISSHARNAGVQGEMRDWVRRLGKNGVLIVDADWRGLRG